MLMSFLMLIYQSTDFVNDKMRYYSRNIRSFAIQFDINISIRLLFLIIILNHSIVIIRFEIVKTVSVIIF